MIALLATGAAAAMRPGAPLPGAPMHHSALSSVQRAPFARMQQSERQRLLSEIDEELGTFEKKLKNGANRRAILAGVAAGTIGSLADGNFGFGEVGAGANDRRLADKDKFAGRAAAAKVEVAKDAGGAVGPTEPAGPTERDVLMAKMEATERDLLAKVGAAEARVEAAESRLAQNQLAQSQAAEAAATAQEAIAKAMIAPNPPAAIAEAMPVAKAETKLAAVAGAGQLSMPRGVADALSAAGLMTFQMPTGLDLNSPILIGGLAAAVLGETVTLLAANSQISVLKKDADELAAELLTLEEALAGARGPWRGEALTRSAAVGSAVASATELETPVSKEEAAKRAWLARLDAPTWGKAGAATRAVTVSAVTVSAVATVIEPETALSKEEAAKRAWLARLDAPTWGQGKAGASAATRAAAPAARPSAAAVSAAAPVFEPETALSKEEAAKRAWLARLDAATWGQGKAGAYTGIRAAAPAARPINMSAASPRATAVAPAMPKLSEAEAKRAWLSKLDVPTWGNGQASAPAAAAAPTYATPTYTPSAASAAPPSPKVSEDEAKRAWLARLDVPTWGMGQASTPVVAATPIYAPPVAMAAPSPKLSEAEAKRAWLAKLDVPTWGKGQASAPAATPAATPTYAPALATAAPSTKLSEAEAKRAWLAKLDVPTWGKGQTTAPVAAATPIYAPAIAPKLSEAEAKRAWLARLDVPTWGKGQASAPAAAATPIYAPAVATAAPLPKLSEAEAKRAWLAKLDVPTWGKGQASAPVAAATPIYAPAVATAASSPNLSEAEAKRAWLARLDVPIWGKGQASAPAVTAAASPTYTPSTADVVPALPKLSEEEAKRAWLARLDVPAGSRSVVAGLDGVVSPSRAFTSSLDAERQRRFDAERQRSR